MLETYPDVLTVKEVAEILRMSPRAIYKHVEQGAIKSFRLKAADGRPVKRVFVPKKALLDYMGVGE